MAKYDFEACLRDDAEHEGLENLPESTSLKPRQDRRRKYVEGLPIQVGLDVLESFLLMWLKGVPNWDAVTLSNQLLCPSVVEPHAFGALKQLDLLFKADPQGFVINSLEEHRFT